MRRVVLAVLFAAVAVLLFASPAHALGPDCKGDPPTPLSPYGLLANKPAVTSDADPFTTPATSIQSVYGTNFGWWTYDNGCAAGSDILPSLGTNIATLIGFTIPGLAPNWGQSLMTAVVNPTWTTQLDKVVTSTTQATASGVWTPWLTVTLLLVASITLTRAFRGQMPALLTGLAWSLTVLVVVSWTISYPTTSAQMLDSGIQTAVVATAEGFNDTPPAFGQTPAEQAQAALDMEWDQMVRATLYRSWLQGAFGSADSKTATTYGPDLFKATHFSWSEYDTYTADPTGKGKALVDAKANDFRRVADLIQQSDQVAYASFTGANYWDRMGIGLLSLVEVVIVAWFLLCASVIILMAYLLIRLLIPIAPAAGVFFIVEPLRDVAVGWLRKVASLLVMGPLFFLAALLVGRYNAAIMASDLNLILKLVFVGGVAVLAWKLLRPASMAGRLKIPGLAAVTSYLGARGGVKAAEQDDDGFGPIKQRKPWRDDDEAPVTQSSAPVHTGTVAAPAAVPVMERAPVEGIVHAGEDRPGTFAPRPAVYRDAVVRGDLAPDVPEPRSPRELRALSAVALPDEPAPAGVATPTRAPAVTQNQPQHEPITDDRVIEAPAPQPHTVEPERLVDTTRLAEFHPANLTIDQNGNPVFEIYRPDHDRTEQEIVYAT